MDVVVIVILVLAAVILVGSLVAGRVAKRRDRAAIGPLAAELGMRTMPDGVLTPPNEFPYFARRRSPRTRWAMSGDDALLFEFSFRETRHGDDGSRRSRRTCTVLDLPFDAPPFELTTRPRVAFGDRDDTGSAPQAPVGATSERFRDRWSAYGDDDFAHRLLGPEFEAALGELWDDAHTRASEGVLRVQLHGPRLLVAAHHIRVGEYPHRLDLTRRLRHSMPVSLEVFYPLPSDG